MTTLQTLRRASRHTIERTVTVLLGAVCLIVALGVYLCIALGIIWGALAIFIH